MKYLCYLFDISARLMKKKTEYYHITIISGDIAMSKSLRITGHCIVIYKYTVCQYVNANWEHSISLRWVLNSVFWSVVMS